MAKIGCGIDDRHAGPGGDALQVAALPFALDPVGELRFLLITSRNSGRWIIPKGWPVKGLTLPESAAKEAYEEAGVRGTVEPAELGRFVVTKRSSRDRADLPRPVVVFPLLVANDDSRWPERAQRRRRWVSREEALAAVSSPDVARIIADFVPPPLPGIAARTPGEPGR
jgi:8-oxo-dGTP pyrophosphatase MutT (NUDIX family)